MGLVVSNKGEVAILRNAVYGSGTPARNWTMRLFKNDHTPAAADDESDYTEADFTGYSAQDVSGWSNPGTVDNKAKAFGAACVFTAGSGISVPQDVYGYYVTDDDDDDALLWAEAFSPGEATVSLPGQTISVIPTLTLKTED